jgi:3-polyprenyl-4-hydroxybenzoate decarboxylase
MKRPLAPGDLNDDVIDPSTGETDRRWGERIEMSEEVKRRVDALRRELGL